MLIMCYQCGIQIWLVHHTELALLVNYNLIMMSQHVKAMAQNSSDSYKAWILGHSCCHCYGCHLHLISTEAAIETQCSFMTSTAYHASSGGVVCTSACYTIESTHSLIMYQCCMAACNFERYATDWQNTFAANTATWPCSANAVYNWHRRPVSCYPLIGVTQCFRMPQSFSNAPAWDP